MPKRTKPTKVTAYLPVWTELTKLKSGNSLIVDVSRGKELLGTLYMGRGSVEWRPKGKRKRGYQKRWRPFTEILTEHMPKAR